MLAKCLVLDGDGHLHSRPMEEKYGYRFVPQCNHTKESDTCDFFFLHPESLLLRQLDVTTSLYNDLITALS